MRGKTRIACVAVLIWLAAFMVAPAIADPLDEADSAYKNRDFKTALDLWRPLADAGVAAAQRGVGILYENGFAVPRDDAQAVAWYQKAAAQGDAEAEYRLGQRYVMGMSVPRSASTGFDLMTKAANQGDPDIQCGLADYYRRGGDGGRAFYWYKKAADQAFARGEQGVALAYTVGLGVARDAEQAKIWSAKATEQYRADAERGDVLAMLALGWDYEIGNQVVPRDLAAALSWYQMAAQRDGPLKKLAQMDVERVERSIGNAAQSK